MPVTSHSQSKWLSGIWICTDSVELLQWIKSINPGPTLREKWEVLDSKYIGKRLILPAQDDSANAIKKTSYKIYTGLHGGTFKVLSGSWGCSR
jgi:hypothetical protein